jgi:predicted phage terminase large subunit-like protein
MKLTEEQQAKLDLVIAARGLDSPFGFDCFYELVFGERAPRHALEEWIEPLYEAREEGKGVVIEAFRGSTKTTTLTIAFTAWRIGKDPTKANLLIQVGDDTASDNTQQIADIIENNPGFKLVFPNVVPDRERGWGAAGYEVKLGDIPYEHWRDMNASRKDPTLLGVSYKSRAIIGRHPDGVLIVDDIHDENNTASERELATVRKILTGTIFPTITKDTWKVFVGTPWVENDALQYVASTGEFEHVMTPVIRDDAYTWPEKFDEEEVERQKNLAGSIEFARMFMLDLSARHKQFFKFQTMDHDNVRSSWPVVAGVDYAGVRENLFKKDTGDRDYFAIAYVAKLPGGGAVVINGVLEKCSQAEAEGYVMRGQNMYPNYLNAIVESDGKGEDFIQVVMRNPNMKIIPRKTGGKGKDSRFMIMQPWLESGQVRISNAESPFLNELRKELNTYPLCRYDDALDALYYALLGIKDVLSVPSIEAEIPEYIPEEKKMGNPIYAVDWSNV